jgi:hypothetical protein
MTRSCRSRAIRSLSSYSDSRSASARLAASSSATPAWATNERQPDLAHRVPGSLGGALVGGEVGRRHRLAGDQNAAGQGLAGRQHQAAGRIGAIALGVGDDQSPSHLVGQSKNGQVGF